MERSEYLSYITEQGFEDLISDIMSVFDFFEDYFNVFVGMYPAIMEEDDEDFHLEAFFESTITRLNRDEVLYRISRVQDELYEYEFFRPIQNSLSTNVEQYTDVRGQAWSDKRNATKFLKVLCSMYCFTRTLVFLRELNDIKFGRSNKQVVLAVGSCDTADCIYSSVKEEVDNVWETARFSNQACVIPAVACSFDIFSKLMSKFNYSIVHIAGHGRGKVINGITTYYLAFLDKEVYLNDFSACFHFGAKHVILNCCNSYDFVDRSAFVHSTYTVVHQDTVCGCLARDMSKDFYDRAWNHHVRYSISMAQSIATANSIETFPHRYWLLN